jgi:hypothetical protein
MQDGTKVVILSWLRLRLRVLAGKLYNLAGVPGIVRDCDYTASVCDARIQVRAKELFTIITVNGLDIFFHRLTGEIDGVGLGHSPIHCKLDQTLGSEQFPVSSSWSRRSSQIDKE